MQVVTDATADEIKLFENYKYLAWLEDGYTEELERFHDVSLEMSKRRLQRLRRKAYEDEIIILRASILHLEYTVQKDYDSSDQAATNLFMEDWAGSGMCQQDYKRTIEELASSEGSGNPWLDLDEERYPHPGEAGDVQE